MAPRSRPGYERVDVPQQFIDLAQRRTEFLFHVMTYGSQPMNMVLASAYLQGLGDAADAIEHKAEREGNMKLSAPLPWHC
jgi:hypothetical protein